jgi:hypothetical protein
MRKALITCAADPAEGAWWDVYKLAESTFKPYAEKHGYEYKAFWHPDFKEEEWPGLFHGKLPVWALHPDMTQPCWMKIPAIIKSLEVYDAVVYLDNDAVILKDDRDILDDLPPLKWLGMSEGTTGEGTGPNVGVVATRSCPMAQRFWREAWDREEWRSAKWTDQGNVFACLGFNHNPPITKLRASPYDSGYHVLSSEWNDWTEAGKAHPWTRIYHAAWGPPAAGNKLGWMQKALKER